MMCMCPTRGERLSATAPKTGTIRTFSVRYWMNTLPRASCSGIGGSTINLGGGSLGIATYGVGPSISRAVWAAAPSGAAEVASAASDATTRTAMVIGGSSWLRQQEVALPHRVG